MTNFMLLYVMLITYDGSYVAVCLCHVHNLMTDLRLQHVMLTSCDASYVPSVLQFVHKILNLCASVFSEECCVQLCLSNYKLKLKLYIFS